MSFAIEKYLEDGFQILALIDRNSNTKVEIVPGKGAMLHSFTFQHQGQPLNIIDGYKDSQDYDQFVRDSFKNVKLSPFACRVQDASYTWEEQAYKIEKTSIHGLLFDVNFDLISEDADAASATVQLRHDYKATDAGYPFAFSCQVQYRLSAGNQLQVTTVIVNQSGQSIPIVDGWHPYFSTGTPVDDLELRFACTGILEFNDKLIPTGKTLPEDRFTELKSLKDISLDNSFLLDFSKPQPLCTIYDPVKKININFYPAASYPILQIYTPPHRKSIAVENLSGAPDAYNNGIHLVKLAANERKEFSTIIEVK